VALFNRFESNSRAKSTKKTYCHNSVGACHESHCLRSKLLLFFALWPANRSIIVLLSVSHFTITQLIKVNTHVLANEIGPLTMKVAKVRMVRLLLQCGNYSNRISRLLGGAVVRALDL